MQEQLLEKHVPEYPVAGPNPSPHHYFQNCKQQTGVSLSFLCASAPLFLSFCSLIALLLLFPRVFPIVPQWLFPFIRHPFTSCRDPFHRPSLAFYSSFFTATSPFCSPSLLQPALPPPFTHIYRTWQDAENSHSKRNWWHVLGAGSGHRLQRKALPSWRWRISFNENERHKDYLGRKKEKPSNL